MQFNLGRLQCFTKLVASAQGREVSMLAAIASHHRLPIYKTETKQAFLQWKRAEHILVRPGDWQ